MSTSAAAVVVVLGAGACSAPDAGSDSGSTGQASAAPELGPLEESAVSALDDPEADGLPEPLIDTDALVSGGPPPDGIPALSAPDFEEASAADWLEDTEAVLAVEEDGDARASPVRIMVWQEIVDDTAGECRCRSPTARCATRRWPSTGAWASGYWTSGFRGRCTTPTW